jgi:hypothetical protein
VRFSQKSFVVAALAAVQRRPVFWFMNDILSKDHFNPLLVRFLVTLARFPPITSSSTRSQPASLARFGWPPKVSASFIP